MLAPLTPRQKADLVAMMGTVLAWVSDGYRTQIAERFPEVIASKPRAPGAAAPK
jgi:hypothetical protein